MLYLFLYLADFLKTSSKDLIFSSYRPCAHVAEFTAQYFTVFIAIENGVFPQLLLAMRNATIFVDLVSWPECLSLSFSSLSFVGPQSHCLRISLPFPVTWDSWEPGL